MAHVSWCFWSYLRPCRTVTFLPTCKLLAPSLSHCTPTELRQVRAAVKSLDRLAAPTGGQLNRVRPPFSRGLRVNSERFWPACSREFDHWTLSQDGSPRLCPNLRTSPLSTWASCAWPRETSCRSVYSALPSQSRAVRHQRFKKRRAVEVAELHSSGVLPEPYTVLASTNSF